MPQRKPVMLKSSRHIDGIREMIDFVRTQQGPITRETTSTDFRLKRHAKLPGIGELDVERQRPSGPYREAGLFQSGDSDPAYESDEDIKLDTEQLQRTPSPPIRSNSVLSSKSSHNLSQTMYVGRRGSRTLLDDKFMTNSSLRDPEPLLIGSRTKLSRTLPPVRRSSSDHSRTPVPSLDLSDPEKDPDDWMNSDDAIRPSAPSPDSASARDDDSFGEDGQPIDFIDSR